MEGGILGILGKIGFDWQVALVNLVNFLIIFFVLRHLAFKPIQRVIEKRQEVIKKGLEDAKQAEIDRQMAGELREETLLDAKKEANVIVGNATEKGKEAIEEAKTQAMTERAIILEKASADAESLHVKMKDEFRGEAVDIVLSATKSLFQKEMNSPKNEEFIKNTLEKVS